MSSNPASLRSPRATWLVRSVLAVVGLLLATGVAVDTRPNVAANGMVASPEPLATDVGLAILKAGGTAFDAAAVHEAPGEARKGGTAFPTATPTTAVPTAGATLLRNQPQSLGG